MSGSPFWSGGEANVAAISEEDAIVVEGAEEIVALDGVFPSSGDVDGYPAGVFEIKLGPAMVTGDLTFGFTGGKGETDFEARGNTRAAHRADERSGSRCNCRVSKCRPKRRRLDPSLRRFFRGASSRLRSHGCVGL